MGTILVGNLYSREFLGWEKDWPSMKFNVLENVLDHFVSKLDGTLLAFSAMKTGCGGSCL
jgi:hypothetical protein